MTAATPWIGSSADHYENFPVASWLLPAFAREPIAAVYAFARYADDVADEGEVPDSARLDELDRLRNAVLALKPHRPTQSALQPNAPVIALAEAVSNAKPVAVTHRHVAPLAGPLERYQLQRQWLLDLLAAFEHDVRSKRHPDRASLMHYCSRSADPIGKIVLQVFARLNPQTEPHSNAICSALQLINFLQDFKKDWQVGRLYVPLDELAAAGVSEADIEHAVHNGQAGSALRALIQSQAKLAGALLDSGRPLLRQMPLRLGLELRAVVAGGQRVLDKLAVASFDPIASRPKLGKADFLAMFWQLLVRRSR